MKKAFTLAEIMIVLVIIGVLSAILLPVAIHSAPDENVMKFKKGNNTLGTVIRELVNSDQYYANGDLGMKPDGTLIDGTHDGDNTYFCQTFSDVVSSKEINCIDTGEYHDAWVDLDIFSLEENKEKLDSFCKKVSTRNGIQTSDNIIFYEYAPTITFGMNIAQAHSAAQLINPSSLDIRNFGEYKPKGFDVIYKTFCMDVDGINKGEDPFGYGIRVDGKILYGARAQEWMQKSIQKGD